ncbi:hypothetical protein [Bifidobacterium vansinderenii]|uniref:Uncharacterized protein n=1 Tax=Bifidobacterium vansinderenii TaxID=1984871 RepID=A0A229VY17_9BIFI|nr:hypothetical protein [Bifidobacterium vansinderenii]OXN00511.1 hypothetical protein Tam10B_1381 [Bifidobacterium vansinderenii]
MTVFTDHKRIVNIELKNWDETTQNWSPDWSDDFYDVGGARNLNESDDDFNHPYGKLLEKHDFFEGEPVYEVDDIAYLIDYANDMINGVGDFDTPSPQTTLFVNDLD